MTIRYLNNYSAAWGESLYLQGKYPGQHLYGLAGARKQGVPYTLAPFDDATLLHRISRGTRWLLGDLQQELPVLRAAAPGDVVLSAEPHAAEGLARLRRARLLRQPLVTVAHQPVRPGSRAAAALRGSDAIVCLSRLVADEVLRTGTDAERVTVLPFAPDLDCPLYSATGDDVVVSSGKTTRDHRTLLLALERLQLPAVVYVKDAAGLPRPTGTELVTPATHLDRSGRLDELPFSFEHTVVDLARAAVIVIPLSRTDVLAGLTELADALALGKPVIMTRTPYLDLDIEREGFGCWVPAGDVRAMERALGELWRDPQRRAAMGQRARAVAERGWNAATFDRGMLEVLARVAS